MNRHARRLDLAAATQIILDDEVERCWELIRVGIQTSKLGIDDLRLLIDDLRAGNGMVADELVIELMSPGSERMRVALPGDERTCSASKMLDELERLTERANAVALARGSPDSGDEAGAPADRTPAGAAPDAGRSVAAPPGNGASDAKDADLLGLLARLLGTTPERLESDPAALRAHVERVRAATAAAARDGDLGAAVRALGVDPERIPAALRTVADWLERRTPEAGAAVDRMIAALETAAAPSLGRLAPDAADAERDERLRASARAAIAARLKRPPP